MAKRIEGVEIFATGKHRGSQVVDITQDDLAEMVNSFNELTPVGGFQPMLKLGHTEVQKFFGNRKGAPNLGIVDKIWIEGNKILADFANVPDALFELIKERRFNSVSIEMFPKTEFNGKQFKNVLTAVALLGAELPAVKGLKELAATLFTAEPDGPEFTGEVVELKEQNDMTTYSQEQVDALVEAAVGKAVETVQAEFAEQVSTLETSVADAETAKKTAEDNLRTFEDDTRKATAEAMVDKAIEDGKVLPKNKDSILALALNITGSVKFGDKEESMSQVFAEFIDSLPKVVDLDEKGNGGSPDKGEYADASAEVHVKADAKMKANDGMDYATARTVVLSEDEELKVRYFGLEE